MLNDRKDIAKHLKVHPETLTKFLDSIGVKKRQKLSPKEVEFIMDNSYLYLKITRLKLAKLYKVHPETLSKKLREKGIKHSNKLTFQELISIYKTLGTPRKR